MQDSFKNSFPGGKSQERGGILVTNKNGDLKVVNEATGTSGTFQPNRSVPAGDQIVGTYHTHPYDNSEGGYQGVSFSGADIAYAGHYNEPILVDAGNRQFMITPTASTPANKPNVSSDWDAAFALALSSGNSMQQASASATKSVANKYNMAYYEGADGTLKKVN
jgi:hypothetical protein